MDIRWIAASVLFASVVTGCAALLAWAAGSLSPAIGIASLVAGSATAVLAVRSLRGAGLEDAAPLRSEGLWGVLALAAFAAASLRQFGWLAYERDGMLLTLLPYNYGDLPLHWTYVQHFAGGAPFWPENPILTQTRLSYPFGVDLLTAVFVQLGVSLRVLLVVMGLAGAAVAAFALRAWGGAFAVAAFLFAGGGLRDENTVAWKNLFLALFVPQRGFLLALPAGLLLLWSWRRRFLRSEPALPPWIEGVVWGAMPLVHVHTFAFVSVVFAVWALATGRVRQALPTLAWALLPATWAVWQVTDGFAAASLVGWWPGWMIRDENPLVFLLLNFGFFIPVTLVALWIAGRERRREDLLLLLPALAVFAALFLVKLAPWEWDNTKVMLWCFVAVLPPLWDLALARLRQLYRAPLIAALFFSGSVCVLGASLGPGLQMIDLAEYDAVCGALRSLKTARVATEPTFNHPVALCGRPLVAGYAGHLWSHGLDYAAADQGLASLLRGDPGWREQARALGASHLYWGRREAAAFPTSAQPWVEAGTPVASGTWGTLYQLD